MGLFSRSKPKIKVEDKKKDNFSGWIKCSGCSEMIHANELTDNLNCCPKCDHHYRLTSTQRIDLIADKDSYKEMFKNIKPVDPLEFQDTKSYADRLKEAEEKTSNDEAISVGVCKIFEQDAALAVMDFNFMGGSMGSVVGERIVLIVEHAIEENLPVIIVSASGGARMQESIFSLMQMAKTSAALSKLDEKGLPFISILTNPTTGGVTASFASLGDIILAEPEALIGFTGPRVVEQTIKQKLPPGAQKSEFLLEKGMIDLIVKRKDLKKQIKFFIEFLTNNRIKVIEKLPQKLKNLLKMSEPEKKADRLAIVEINDEN
ncbi:MAG: acetyl-CoA carboxylase carboxyltransferase subunit beta [Parachlamydiales bacterium]|nr:acetyl-CoA carboxylase carboxyltransferase subunit beta [Parachlamydiales bacterium]